MFNISRKRVMRYGLAALAIVAIVIFSIYRKNGGVAVDYVVVKRGDVAQEVSVTGTVKPVQAVSLAFERGGKVTDINVKVGNTVNAGQVLISLNAEELRAQLRQAQAGVEVAEAQLRQYQATLESQEIKLTELERGARLEELKIAETKVANAEKSLVDAEENLTNVKSKADIDLANAYDDVKDTLSDAYVKSDDAVRVKSAGAVTGDIINGYNITFNSCDSAEETAVESLRRTLEQNLNDWETELNTIDEKTEFARLDEALSDSEKYLVKVKNYLDRVNNLLTTSCSLANSTLSTDRTNMNTARTNINTAVSAVNVQKQTIASQKATNSSAVTTAVTTLNTAKNTLATARDELVLEKAGTSKEAIGVQKALVKQAQANVDAQKGQIKQAQANAQNYEAQIAKTVLRAPFKGVVTKVDADLGEVVAANAVVSALMSFSKFEIETNIPEVDIGKLSLEDPVKITLDAFPGEVFTGKVSTIEPAETIVDGVVNFKTKVLFDKTDERLKSGLTANLDIETDRKTGVLILPQYAVVENDQGSFARKQEIGGVKDYPLQTGIRSRDGNIEIISGVSEGESVLNIGAKNSAQ